LEKNTVYTFTADTVLLVSGDITKLKSAENTTDTCKSIVKEIKLKMLRARFTHYSK
jgi:hypothetical protein